MARKPKSEALGALHEAMSDLRSIGAISADEMGHFEQACLREAKSAPKLRFEIHVDEAKRWHWRLLDRAGRVIATSGEGLRSKRSCLDAIALVKASAAADIAA